MQKGPERKKELRRQVKCKTYPPTFLLQLPTLPLTHSPHSLIHPRSHPVTHSPTHLNNTSTHSFTHSPSHHIYSLTHSLTHSFIHSFTHSFTHSLTHSLIHSITHSLGGLGRGRMCEKFHQLLAVGRWFPPGTPVSSTRSLVFIITISPP